MLRFKGFEISVGLLAVFISESRLVSESESDIFSLPLCFGYLLETSFAAPLLLPLEHFCLYEVLDSRYNSANGSSAL